MNLRAKMKGTDNGNRGCKGFCYAPFHPVHCAIHQVRFTSFKERMLAVE